MQEVVPLAATVLVGVHPWLFIRFGAAGFPTPCMRSLRASERPGERTPALALTAFARAEDRKRSLVAGYQAHIAKPFDLGELVLLVANLAGR